MLKTYSNQIKKMFFLISLIYYNLLINLFTKIYYMIYISTGNSCTTNRWKDGKRANNVLHCDLHHILLICCFWLLGFWQQFQLKSLEQLTPQKSFSFSSYLDPLPCHSLHSPSTSRHRNGPKYLSTIQFVNISFNNDFVFSLT